MESDDTLVVRSRDAGDADAFAELVRRYRGPVFRLTLSILGQGFAAEAEEVTQDVMLRVHHGLKSFRGDAKFSSWIYRIGFNQALNLKARVRYRAPHVSDDALTGMASAEGDPLNELEARRRKRAVLECVAELPEVYQSALRVWQSPSLRAVASRAQHPLPSCLGHRRPGLPARHRG